MVVMAPSLGILVHRVKAHVSTARRQNCLVRSDPVQTILAANVRALMQANPSLKTQGAVADATRRAGLAIDQKTVGRVLKASHAVQLDTVQALAAAFGVEPYQLLIPGLDPKNPQILRALSKAEENLYKALEAARKNGTQ